MDKIAVLIPCYNESKTIAKVVRDWKTELPESSVYVYDNNSNDKTAEIARKNGAIVKYEHCQGKGNVVRRMFREIDAECYILVDGDDTYPVENAQEMINLVVNDKVDMVVGDRLSSTYYTENKRPFHNFGNKIVRSSINTIFKSDIKDIMTGYRAFSYQFVKSFPILCKGFEIETEMTIHAIENNMFVRNVEVTYRDRPTGSESKLNTVSDGLKVLKTIFKLWEKYRPISFFSIFALIFTLAFLGCFIPMAIEYYKTAQFSIIFFMLSLCAFLIASMLFITGVIIDAIKRKSRQDFEQKLIFIQNEYEKKNEIV